MTAEGFQTWGDVRRRKSIITRQPNAGKNATEIRTFYDSHPDSTREELARIFDVSQSTIKGLSLRMDETRRDKAAKQTEDIRAFKVAHPHMSNRAVAKVFGVDEKVVRLALKTAE